MSRAAAANKLDLHFKKKRCNLSDKTVAPVPANPVHAVGYEIAVPRTRTELVECSQCGDRIRSDRLPRHSIEKCSKRLLALSSPLSVPVVRLPFEILPPGTWDEKRVIAYFHHQETRKCLGKREFDMSRIKRLASLGPAKCYAGKETWRGYLVLEFAKWSAVVVESPIKGNATYIMASNWRDVIGETKQAINTLHARYRIRVVHSGEWLPRVRASLIRASADTLISPVRPLL